jgi:hypothetical protein
VRTFLRLCIIGVVTATTALTAVIAQSQEEKEKKDRVFELRTYTPAPGKMDALLARFRDHTSKLFEKHGIQNIGYWVTTDPQVVEGKEQEPKLIYLLAHKSRDAAKESWKAFAADPAWAAARTESEKNGRLAVKVEALYLAPTDFSAIK